MQTMTTQRIQLHDLLEGVIPYEPHLMRTPMRTEDLMPEQLASAAAKTAKDILRRSGVPNLEVTEEDAENARAMFMDKLNRVPQAISPYKLQKPETVIKLEALVAEYDWQVIQHADQIRMLVTNKLLGLSDHRDPKVQLKAVELLGKLADVGMFVEKQEVTYKQKSEEELQTDLMEKLGILIEGDFEEVPTQPAKKVEPTKAHVPTPPPIKVKTAPSVPKATEPTAPLIIPLPILPEINFNTLIDTP